MAIDFKSPSAVALNQGIKAVVHGPAGAGKTALCTTGKEPTLLVSAEAGLLSIRETKADIKIVETKTISDISSVLDHLEATKDFATVCLDSISEIAEIVLSN